MKEIDFVILHLLFYFPIFLMNDFLALIYVVIGDEHRKIGFWCWQLIIYVIGICDIFANISLLVITWDSCCIIIFFIWIFGQFLFHIECCIRGVTPDIIGLVDILGQVEHRDFLIILLPCAPSHIAIGGGEDGFAMSPVSHTIIDDEP